MNTRTPLVAGNWKMNGNRSMAAELISQVLEGAGRLSGVEIAICPPFVLISQAVAALHGGGMVVGGQDLDPSPSGAFTGQTSAELLVDQGCHFVIVGHSERRTLYGDHDHWVAEKAGAAHAAGLWPIVCVGETLAEREAGDTEMVVQRQIEAVLQDNDIALFNRAVIAYEPVWAIGTGKTATPEQADAVHRYIRQQMSGRSSTIADSVRVLYGGSVKADNAAALFKQEHIDGGLIGGASLNSTDFLDICAAAANSLC